MASLTLESPPVEKARPDENPPLPPSAAQPPSARSTVPVDDLPAQRAVERRAFRAWGIGMLVGAGVCAAVWCGLVALALVDSSGSAGGMMVTGAACGAFAGIFLGGWAGAVVGAIELEHHEHATRRPL